MKFWKFEAPPLEELDEAIARGGLPPAVVVPGRQNTFNDIAKRLKIGDGVVLATLVGDQGKIAAFGKVRAVEARGAVTSIQWAKASHGVYPTDSGLVNWETKTAFEISAAPAKRYGLIEYLNYHIKDAA